MEAIDFVCGAGGVTCGFQQAQIKVLGVIDIDASCRETYEKNNTAKFFHIDVSNYPVENLSKEINFSKDQDNLIFVGCSPCQYYSNITTDRSKSKKTRYLLADFQEYVAFYRPGHVFIENVPGIETKAGSPLEKFKSFLVKSGYSFSENKLNAKHLGVPQNRLRYVLIASRVKKRIELKLPANEPMRTVRDAIGDTKIFPEVPAGFFDNSFFAHTTANLSDLNIERLKNTPSSGGDKRDWPKELLLDSNKNYSGHYDVYGRVDWDKPAPTITTKFRSLSNGRFGHPEQNRALSLREGATLQSFPLNYTFYSNSQGTVGRMIGNAVPPKLAKFIGEQFK